MKINIGLFIGLILIFWFVKRDSLIYVINWSLPQQEAGLMAGILLGDKAGFDKDFYEKLTNSGLIHLVVVSGSNVMLLIGGLIEQMAKWLGRKRSILVGLAVGWWYVYLVGWEIPVLRAMLLMSILYFAQLLGRKYNLWRALSLVVLMMVVADVRILASVSFWLSIMAFVAIITIRSNDFMKTIWVSIFISPILAMVFGKISLISPFSNFLVIGIVEWLTVMGALGLFWLTIPMLKYLEIVVELGAKFPVMEISFNWMMLIGYYLILLYFLILNKKKISPY